MKRSPEMTWRLATPLFVITGLIAVAHAWPAPTPTRPTADDAYRQIVDVLIRKPDLSGMFFKQFLDHAVTQREEGYWIINGRFSYIGMPEAETKTLARAYTAVLKEPTYPKDTWSLVSLEVDTPSVIE